MNYSIELPISEDFRSGGHFLVVESDARESWKAALETMAEFFKKESRYTHLQYCQYEHSADCFGILFVERARDQVQNIDHHPHRVIGGACFWQQLDESFCLDWIWLHPFARNRGMFKQCLTKFEVRFGRFSLTFPLSPEMEKFAEKYRPELLK